MGDWAVPATRRGWLRLAAAGLVVAGATAIAGPAHADRFADWLKGVRTDARAKGIRSQTLDAAFAGVQPLPKVIELDRKQPEFTLTFLEYLDRVMPQMRIDR